MNVSLPGPMKDWTESRTKEGSFANTSDYVRHLIRQDKEREEAIAHLQTEIDRGIASGEPAPFDFEEFKAVRRREHGQR